jgi:glutaconate CoA-transferase subunit B
MTAVAITYLPEELMAVAIAREVRDGEAVATGANSPIPASGCLLATRLHAPSARAIILGSEAYYPFTSGKEFFDFAQRGQLDLFFLGGIQIDACANINLHVLGSYVRPARRFPGAFGSGVLYYVARRVILFRNEHSRRVFVPHVDFITAPGSTPEMPQRPGGPSKVVTPLAVLAFNRDHGRLELESITPGVSLDEVQSCTGFDLHAPAQIPATPPPTAYELELLRGPVREELRSVYPHFVQKSEDAARTTQPR